MIPLDYLKTQRGFRRSDAGSATVLAFLMLAVVSLIGATVLFNVARLYNGNQKAQGWQEALYAAEAGADIGLANLRWNVVSGSPTAFDSSLGWAKTTTANNTIYTYTTPHMTQSGQGSVESWAVVTVDSPIGDNTTNPPSGLTYKGNQWYRVRSTGHVRLTGLARASNDILSDPNARRSNALRKFSMRYDRTNPTGTPLPIPEATRTIEEIVQPTTPWTAALLANTSLSITGNQVIDSYDPTNSNQFSNGLTTFNQNSPDPTKHDTNGTVMSNGTSSTALTIGSGEKVYGNAATDEAVNNLAFTDPNNTIQSPGTINNSTVTTLPTIPVPNWGTAGNPSINNSVTTVSKSPVTITIDPDPTKNYYKLGDISNNLTVAIPPGTTGTLNIWLTGDMTTKGAMTIPVGATVKVYFTGGTFHPGQNGANVGAINNLNQDPSTFQLYGAGTDPGSGPGIDLHVGGTGVQNFYGTVYAPYRKIILKYDGKTNYDTASGHYGSFVGNTISDVSSVHYDEALNGVGTVTDYIRASYVEDPR